MVKRINPEKRNSKTGYIPYLALNHNGTFGNELISRRTDVPEVNKNFHGVWGAGTFKKEWRKKEWPHKQYELDQNEI